MILRVISTPASVLNMVMLTSLYNSNNLDNWSNLLYMLQISHYCDLHTIYVIFTTVTSFLLPELIKV
jgi:hypothetical protein